MNRTEYKNKSQKEKYDRIPLNVPKGDKVKLQIVAAKMGVSLNEYINMLICDDLSTGESKLANKKKGFYEEQQAMLDKWQVGRKYHEMMEDMSYSKEDGYFIYLKKGYTNDVTKEEVYTAKRLPNLGA